MENQLFSISKIFTERILRIPDYQRGYAWTDKQLKDFWGDLVQLEEDKNHYTGVLTLEEVPAQTVNNWKDDLWIIKSKKYAPYYVVDGQQRLTTSIILIQCIIERTPENQRLNFTLINEIRKKFIFDSKDDGISRSYLFGYEKDNPSYEFLKTKVFLEQSDNSFPMQETIYTHNLERAKDFFLEKFKALDLEEIEKLYSKLTQGFLFNLYTISNDVDVYVAFETMNNRGKPLSHLELLKNRLIYLSTKFDAVDYEKQQLRHAINESWKSIYHYLGKNKANPLDDDVFLFNHFIIYHEDQAHKLPPVYTPPIRALRRGMPSYYQSYLLEEKFTTKNVSDGAVTLPQIYSYVQNLKHSVEIWYKLLNPLDSDFSLDEMQWLEKLNRLGILEVAPLILVFFQKEADINLRIRLLKALERYLFIRSLPEGSYILSQFLGESILNLRSLPSILFTGKTQPEKIIHNIEQQNDSLGGNEEFIRFVIGRFKADGFYKWRELRYFLFEYELELKAQSKTYRDKLSWETLTKEDLRGGEDSRDFYTIEHIYPQNARRACWASKFNRFNEKERNALKHTLGNLVPLSQPKNSSFQNKCFNEKKGNSETKVGFLYGSYSENEVASYEDWTAKEILKRGLKLLNFMEKRWKIKFRGDDKFALLNMETIVFKI